MTSHSIRIFFLLFEYTKLFFIEHNFVIVVQFVLRLMQIKTERFCAFHSHKCDHSHRARFFVKFNLDNAQNLLLNIVISTHVWVTQTKNDKNVQAMKLLTVMRQTSSQNLLIGVRVVSRTGNKRKMTRF